MPHVAFKTGSLSTIRDENNDLLLAATASVALISRDTRRPFEIKVPEGKVVEIYPERSVNYNYGRISELEKYNFAYRTSARYEDIDINNHMNNASYAQMFYEGLAGEMGNMELASIDISFRGEVSLRDELVCFSQPGEGGMYHHKMLNETRNNISALAVTRWR
jgi:acyl-ACP thioesterase